MSKISSFLGTACLMIFFLLSSRNINIAKKLAKKFRSIKVLKDNQEIIDKSSVIFLGITPNVGNKILPKLKFSKNV